MPPRGPANTFDWWETPGVGTKRTGRATYPPWPGKALDSHRLKTLPGEGRLDGPLAGFPASLFFSAAFQNDSALFSSDCEFLVVVVCVLVRFLFCILHPPHRLRIRCSLKLANTVSSGKIKSSLHGQLSRFPTRHRGQGGCSTPGHVYGSWDKVECLELTQSHACHDVKHVTHV